MPARAPKLTRRRQQIADSVCLGLSDKEIAGELGISVSAVRQQLAALRQLFGVKNRVRLAVAYYELSRGKFTV